MRTLVALVVALALGSVALAEDGKKPGRGGADGKNREELLKKFDANGDGKLDDAEKAKAREAFKGAGGKGRPGADGKGKEEFLKKFDANGDGKLDEAEMAKAKEAFKAGAAGKGRPGADGKRPGADGKGREEMLKKFDTNGDGKLDDAEKAKAREALKNRPAKKEAK